MAGGPKKHLKRIAAPKHWCLDKLSGIYAPRPSSGPYGMRECLPLAILIRNRLKYALTYDEVKMILMQRLVKIDGKVRTDKTYPLGFMDTIAIEKTNENFRLLIDTKGRFTPVKVGADEMGWKLCRVRKLRWGRKNIPYAYTHDGRTIRYVHPNIKVNDTVKIDLATGKVLEHVPFTCGALAMVTTGHSAGRVGSVVEVKKTIGAVDTVTLKDARGDTFATKIHNAFVIGGEKPLISLPKGDGVKKTIIEVQKERHL
ncbi:40S ribosomal S4 X protein isoform [Gregarina niphandrodes]|uniref:40S ribosomal protein S4 n=1 Tax=Gregarina niphandrodes TaxID=110365 RepID=A0A023BAW3_GRENI|nr:40S ribosomal S4 X protein isoform [Gregarina niphandrodes]EZG78680.1 40S ribosomal S4 X protein isoform [Gregarina niphandrodes]|eukprot:XP_011129211.1 40S ribosomal S4 X protein isoform [Gregarina niphandrodes]